MDEHALEILRILHDDGTLELAERPSLPAGQVEVTVRRVVTESRGENWFEWLRRIRAEREAAGYSSRTKEEIDADIEEMWDWGEDRIEAAGRPAEGYGPYLARTRARREAEGLPSVPGKKLMPRWKGSVDSVIIISFLNHVGQFQVRAAHGIGGAPAAGQLLTVSDLARFECRVLPTRSRDLPRLADFDGFFRQPDVRLVPLPGSGFDRATVIRADYGFKISDAIHLAAAVESGCDRFLTNDSRLARSTDVAVEIPR